ncbi:hypothetical protein [Clostridium beijerinckii]|uniref:hypothetical protein n=1 Tax=Clostridium beijerinckii TaxID=1520 RepID=UPI001A9BFC56|nr:hypothetical protein [Clostridium beijerinckii]
MRFISKASSGSTVVFTYVIESMINGTTDLIGAETLTTLFKVGGQNLQFGLNPSYINEYLNKYKLQLIEDVGASYYQENYLKPICRKLDVSLIERITYAKII